MLRQRSLDILNETQHTTCCIVGGGPTGIMLRLLLAQQHIPVTVLETHNDFEQDFRGDTVYPSIVELLSGIGLARQNRNMLLNVDDQMK